MWQLSKEGYSPDDCREFDFAHVDFWDWVEKKRSEEKAVTQKKAPKGKNMTWGPKYASDAEIVALYYSEDGRRNDVTIDPIADAIHDEDILLILDDMAG